MNYQPTTPPEKLVTHIFSANAAVFREDNQNKLLNFFKGLISGAYYDGTTYSLYLDLKTHDVIENNVLMPSQRVIEGAPDLVLITKVQGYDKDIAKKRYNPNHELVPDEWGYYGWLEGIEHKIMTIIENH